jgi:hypothetical protein
MAAELTRLTHKIAIQLRLMAESCTVCSSRSRRPVRTLLYTHMYLCEHIKTHIHSSFSVLILVILLNMNVWFIVQRYTRTLSTKNSGTKYT